MGAGGGGDRGSLTPPKGLLNGFFFGTPASLSVAAEAQALYDVLILLRLGSLEVIEQPAALADEHQEAAAGMVIFRVRFEVLGQIVDALAENRDLNFW